jgi:hypothetical protein
LYIQMSSKTVLFSGHNDEYLWDHKSHCHHQKPKEEHDCRNTIEVVYKPVYRREDRRDDRRDDREDDYDNQEGDHNRESKVTKFHSLVAAENPNSTVLTNANTFLSLWGQSIHDPIFTFDQSSGTYHVPSTGNYEINLVVNYLIPTTLSLSTSTTPLIEVVLVEPYDINRPISPVLSGAFPVDAGNVLTGGQIYISGVVQLSKGQKLRVRYNSNNVIASVYPLDVRPIGTTTTLIIKELNPVNKYRT